MYTCLRVSETLELESQDWFEFFPLLDFFPVLSVIKRLVRRLRMCEARNDLSRRDEQGEKGECGGFILEQTSRVVHTVCW